MCCVVCLLTLCGVSHGLFNTQGLAGLIKASTTTRPLLDNNKVFLNLPFLQKLNWKKTFWDQASFSSLV